MTVASLEVDTERLVHETFRTQKRERVCRMKRGARLRTSRTEFSFLVLLLSTELFLLEVNLSMKESGILGLIPISLRLIHIQRTAAVTSGSRGPLNNANFRRKRRVRVRVRVRVISGTRLEANKDRRFRNTGQYSSEGSAS